MKTIIVAVVSALVAALTLAAWFAWSVHSALDCLGSKIGC